MGRQENYYSPEVLSAFSSRTSNQEYTQRYGKSKWCIYIALLSKALYIDHTWATGGPGGHMRPPPSLNAAHRLISEYGYIISAVTIPNMQT